MNKWIRIYHPKPLAKFRLLCIPHAGGSASSYQKLSKLIGENIEVLSIQLPGREDRFKEENIEEMSILVSCIYKSIEPYLDKPFAIFGHSMGAYIGYELTKLLFRFNKMSPLMLYISAASSPNTPKIKKLHHLSDELLLKELKIYNRTPDFLLHDEKGISYFLSYIRSDFKIVDDYSCYDYKSINSPISVFVGNSDLIVCNYNNWTNYTHKDTYVFPFNGDHFYLQEEENLNMIIKIIKRQLLQNYEHI